MGSPVTFSGFNNIDFNLVLGAIMQQASAPLTVLQDRKSDVDSRLTRFGTFTSHLLALQDAADGLSDATKVTTLSATSSDAAAVTASVGTSATAGQYDVVVNSLARAQVTVSASTSPDADATIVAGGGSITIGGTAVAISGDVTLQQLADAINAEDLGVTAAVVRTGTDAYRLALTSTQSGLDNAFTIVNSLTGGTGVTFTDTDSNGTIGDSAADNAVNASDASLLFNNIAVTGSTNTFEDLVPGLTLTALRQDPAATVRVDVASDGDALKTRIEDFVSAYNTLVAFQNQQRVAVGEGDTSSIGGDPLVRQVRSTLRTALLGAHGSGVFTRLSEVGIEFSRTGELELNETVFNDALASQGDDVRALFAGVDGAFTAIATELEGYTQAGGLLGLATDRLEGQRESMDDQIAAMQTRLALQRESLMRQFIEADLAMSRLNNQSGALASFGSGLNL